MRRAPAAITALTVMFLFGATPVDQLRFGVTSGTVSDVEGNVDATVQSASGIQVDGGSNRQFDLHPTRRRPVRRPLREEIFASEGRLLSEGRIFSVATSDFNRDGRPDLVVSDYLNPARILFNDAGQRFDDVVQLTSTAETATSGHGVALGDFNGDGNLDLFLVYNRFPARVLFGDGTGGFTDSGRAIGRPDLSGTSVAVGDVDQDGDLDALVTYYQEPALLYLNDGNGAFALSDQTFFDDIALGDIDLDGDLDVVSLRDEGPASIWTNDGGSFTLQDRTVGGADGISRIALVDADGDGDLDVVAGGLSIDSELWENDGHGAFRRTAQTFNAATRITAGDLDRDGRTDLVIGPSVWISRGGTIFVPVQTLPFATNTALHLVDVDGDGDLDLLAAELDFATGRADLELFLNTLPQAGRY